MTPNSTQAKVIKETLDNLIHSASNAQLSVLETLYHENMTIHMLDETSDLHQMGKRDFIDFLKLSTKDGDTPGTWAKYHLVEADEKNGHVLISRKVNLGSGKERNITLSIDFVFEDERWQITREVIFSS